MSSQTRTRSALISLTVMVKSLDGAIQVLAALLLAAVPPAVISGIANAVITRDLLGDHTGAIADDLTRAAEGGRTFAVVFLLLHGVVKLGLAYALHRRAVRLYPLACLLMSALVIYESIRAVRTGSLGLVVFALLDTAVVVVVAREFWKAQQH
ncbi:Uncharacterized membrane protein [Actinokineospora alba]|uniref:Uncharacterized membrane protein n=1 Tax=Actinokineospora alba TaxID=504798 RepID=A0A1H0LML8_9PSEU|nr:DUF2127 domain-containing protein [Actinokineospora alba]TDP67383.1 putative membrane protein [Actinokineospora alba]SDI98265.1 Uncharacterized membrane protein [Actinokineospora alba]SDO69462.1 Uncharacterized membrane protein [Actinokineospora alba]